ncbi:unnamed protein product [Merluccius merluccius]
MVVVEVVEVEEVVEVLEVEVVEHRRISAPPQRSTAQTGGGVRSDTRIRFEDAPELKRSDEEVRSSLQKWRLL